MAEDSESSSISTISFHSCEYERNEENSCLQSLSESIDEETKDWQEFEFQNYVAGRILTTPEELLCDLYVTDCKQCRFLPRREVKEALLGNDSIDLAYCDLSTFHTRMILEILTFSPLTLLRNLDLTENQLNVAGCVALADFMQRSTHLKTLILKKCK